MLAAGGLMILVAMGYAVSGMVAEGDQAAPDGDLPAGGRADGDGDFDEVEMIEGAELANFVFGTDGDDDLAGGNGEDWLDGKAGADTLDGGAGNDVLRLGSGDQGTGGDGDDRFEVIGAGQADDPFEMVQVMDFQIGTDRLILEFDGAPGDAPEIGFDTDSTPGSTIVLANGFPAAVLFDVTGLGPEDIDVRMIEGDVIEGTGGNDTLAGTDRNDTIDGYAGDDLLDGGTGDDLLRGREGMDSLLGGGGDDAITGGPGADTIEGGPDNDMLIGNEGNDLILGGAGADEAWGEDGDDRIDGGAGTDFLVGGAGNDSVAGGDDADLLFGNEGDDLLSGEDGDDYLQGGFGADTLSGGAGNDRLDGTYAAGDSIFGPFDEDQGDVLDGGAGDDTIVVGANDLATGGEGADRFVSGSYIEMAEVAGHVTDFDPSQDVIEVMFDPDLTPDPMITVEDFADGTGAFILFEGQMILSVSGAQGLNPAMIELREVMMDRVAEPA